MVKRMGDQGGKSYHRLGPTLKWRGGNPGQLIGGEREKQKEEKARFSKSVTVVAVIVNYYYNDIIYRKVPRLFCFSILEIVSIMEMKEMKEIQKMETKEIKEERRQAGK